MDFKAHLVIGSLATVITAAILYFTTSLLVMDIMTLIMIAIIAYVYPLLPDLDHPISTITWNFLGIGIVGIVIAIANNYLQFIDNGTTIMIASVILLILTFVCAQFIGHRGPIHTVAAGAIFAAAFYFIGNNVGLCLIAFVAYYSHLAADGLWFNLY